MKVSGKKGLKTQRESIACNHIQLATSRFGTTVVTISYPKMESWGGNQIRTFMEVSSDFCALYDA